MININKLKQKTIQELLEFGIINIDKPSGPTSFDVSDFVREKLGLRKTSHFGTLDPKVTGVLPIAPNTVAKDIKLSSSVIREAIKPNKGAPKSPPIPPIMISLLKSIPLLLILKLTLL